MNKPRGKQKRVHLNARIDPETMENIIKLSEELHQSRGVVIDYALKALIVSKYKFEQKEQSK